MKTSNSKIASPELAGIVQTARLRVAATENRWKAARERARLSKRRRKEVKLIARRARKQAKQAKADLAKAREALAEAEAKLAKSGKPPADQKTAKDKPAAKPQATTGRKRTAVPRKSPPSTSRTLKRVKRIKPVVSPAHEPLAKSGAQTPKPAVVSGAVTAASTPAEPIQELHTNL